MSSSLVIVTIAIQMDKTPKTKFFGFKSRTPIHERPTTLDNRFISKNEVCDLETLPISPDVMHTSPMSAMMRINKVNQSPVGQLSPQFIVGWNDGAEKSDIDMNSPIRSVPVLRKIRRCPDSLMFKAPKTRPKDDSDGAILQCIDWAKNLFESTNLETEILPGNEKKVTESRNVTKDIDIDILDDSSDEIMILCSQAVEESLPLSKNPTAPSIAASTQSLSRYPASQSAASNTHFHSNHPATTLLAFNTVGKHLLTRESNQSRAKRLKIDRMSDGDYSTITKKDPRKDNAPTCNNNNIVKSDNFNFKSSSNVSLEKSCSKHDVKAVNSAVPTSISAKFSNSSASVQDPSQTFLDDDDDLFGSFDFHAIDKLQNTSIKNYPLKSFGSHLNIAAATPKLNENRNLVKPVPKYTKEQIEQRRLEAKKRLMFNRKHKSV